MHRALAEHVRDRFLGRGVVAAARSSMVATAVEVSLKYPSQSKAQTQTHAGDVDTERPSEQAQTDVKTRQSDITLKEAGSYKNLAHENQKFELTKKKKKKKIR